MQVQGDLSLCKERQDVCLVNAKLEPIHGSIYVLLGNPQNPRNLYTQNTMG